MSEARQLKTPSAKEINEIHQLIKKFLQVENIPVLYGGSITETNAAFLRPKVCRRNGGHEQTEEGCTKKLFR